MRKFAFLAALAAGVCIAAGANSVTLRELHGVCQNGSSAGELGSGIGWDRYDFHWSALEPEAGKWRGDVLEDMLKGVRDHAANGLKVLPILCYDTGWSSAALPREYRAGDRIVRLEKLPDGKIRRIEYIERDGSRQEVANQVRDHLGAGPLAPEMVPAWENYVRRTVTALMAPPYNLEYFQIWNEASPLSGFWDGDLDTYMRQIHLPAAKIIRELGGKVVYGGWPCCETDLKWLVELLDRHDAWGSIDVVDVHYFGAKYMPYLREEGLKRGHNLGVWQTEYGFNRDYGVIPSMVMPNLEYLLSQEPFHPDLVKVMYFARWSPDDPAAYGYGNCLYRGETLTGHGRALKNLGDMFGYDEIALLPLVQSDFRGVPRASFVAGDRLVTWCDLEGKNLPAGAEVTLTLADTDPEAIARVERRGMFGEVLDLTAAARVVNDKLQVTVPVDEDPANTFTDGDLLKAPADNRRKMFFVVWYLR